MNEIEKAEALAMAHLLTRGAREARKREEYAALVAIENKMSARAAKQKGWPDLVGTYKQIAWAETLRSRWAAENPDSPDLMKKKKASWWIENRPVCRY